MVSFGQQSNNLFHNCFSIKGPHLCDLQAFLEVLRQREVFWYSLDIGGGVVTGMAVFDTMRHIRPDVSTVCVGLAARYVSSFHLFMGAI
jgi:ATP-dependent protease ClpP protease subunit